MRSRPTSALDSGVEAVRHFNRFYTRRIGVLREGLLRSPFSLTQGRVLYELAHRRAPTAVDLRRELGLDAGYLSRLLAGFRKKGLVSRERSESDGRRSLLRLTRRGRQSFAVLDARARAEVRGLLRKLDRRDQGRLIDDMRGIETLLGGVPQRPARYVLRPPRPGDLGWVVHQHGLLYAEEYGWGSRFEALVARIVAEFVEHRDPKRERCWIAESGDGERVGSVFLVKKSQAVA